MPYKGWNNKRVTEQVCEGYRLEKPSACPDEVYRIMIDCWNKNVKVCAPARYLSLPCFISFPRRCVKCTPAILVSSLQGTHGSHTQRRATFASINRTLVQIWKDVAMEVSFACSLACS
jgi:hypothetical protein